MVCRWTLLLPTPPFTLQILVAAETNDGINNLVKKLLEVGLPREEVLRIGAPGKDLKDPELKHVSFEQRYRYLV